MIFRMMVWFVSGKYASLVMGISTTIMNRFPGMIRPPPMTAAIEVDAGIDKRIFNDDVRSRII
jgi:hypothetical protein